MIEVPLLLAVLLLLLWRLLLLLLLLVLLLLRKTALRLPMYRVQLEMHGEFPQQATMTAPTRAMTEANRTPIAAS